MPELHLSLASLPHTRWILGATALVLLTLLSAEATTRRYGASPTYRAYFAAFGAALLIPSLIVVLYAVQAAPQRWLWMIVISLLTLLTLIDARCKVLPNLFTLPLLLLGLWASWKGYTITWTTAWISALAGFLVLYIPAQLYAWRTRRDGVGYGDFKLMAAIGAWTGWMPMLWILIAAGLSAALLGSIYIRRQQLSKHHTIPFGPYLAITTIVYVLIHVIAFKTP